MGLKIENARMSEEPLKIVVDKLAFHEYSQTLDQAPMVSMPDISGATWQGNTCRQSGGWAPVWVYHHQSVCTVKKRSVWPEAHPPNLLESPFFFFFFFYLSHLAQVQDITHIVRSGQLTHSEASKIGQRVHSWVQGYVVSSILNYFQVRDECHQQRQSDGTAFIDARRFLMKSNHEFGNQKWLSWIRAVMHFVNEPDCWKVRLDSSWLQSQISQVRHI